LAAIKLKYDKLEEEFSANRKKVSEELHRYMEREVGTVLTEMSKNRKKIEGQIGHDNQVCYTACVYLSSFNPL